METVPRIKVLVAGDTAVGKSALIKRQTEGKFVARYISTIGVDYGVLPAEVKGKHVRCNFFDLSGESGYAEVRSEFYKDGHALVLVFDVCARSSFDNLQAWLDEAATHGLPPDVEILVCGNKTELSPRAVPREEAEAWCRKQASAAAAARGGGQHHPTFPFFETSVSLGEGVKELFDATFATALDYVTSHR
jgi:DnaJ family protein C protein 27